MYIQQISAIANLSPGADQYNGMGPEKLASSVAAWYAYIIILMQL